MSKIAIAAYSDGRNRENEEKRSTPVSADLKFLSADGTNRSRE
jgi:hypothetical protein